MCNILSNLSKNVCQMKGLQEIVFNEHLKLRSYKQCLIPDEVPHMKMKERCHDHNIFRRDIIYTIQHQGRYPDSIARIRDGIVGWYITIYVGFIVTDNMKAI